MTDAISGTSSLAGAQGARLPRPGEFRQAILDSAAKALGMSAQDVQAALQGGQSLADLAQQQGVSTNDLVGAVAGGLQQLAGSDAAHVAQRVVDHEGGFVGQRRHRGGAEAGGAGSSPFQVLSRAIGVGRGGLLGQTGPARPSLGTLLDTTA